MLIELQERPPLVGAPLLTAVEMPLTEVDLRLLGALGLRQVRNSTGRWLHFGEKKVRFEEMF